MLVLPKGVRHMPGHLDRHAQEALVEAIREVVQAAPLYVPTMPSTGKEMSVRMTNCGALGWVTDKERGYRYQATHPVTGDAVAADSRHGCSSSGRRSPAIRIRRRPAWSISIPTTPRWACTRTATKQDFRAPVVSVSLGDACLFRVGETSARWTAPCPSGWKAATSSCSAARGGSASTASTASIRRHLDAAEEGRPDQPDAAARDRDQDSQLPAPDAHLS